MENSEWRKHFWGDLCLIVRVDRLFTVTAEDIGAKNSLSIKLVIAFIYVVAPKGAVCLVKVLSTLCSLSTDSAGQLNVLGHDGDALGVDGAQVGVFKQTNKVSLASFLKSHDSGALETQIGLEILSDFSHKTLEGQLADQQLGGFLVTTDLTVDLFQLHDMTCDHSKDPCFKYTGRDC